MLERNVVDQLHDDDGLADTRATEEASLAALGVGLEEIDNLDTGFEHLGFGGLLFERRRGAVDGHALLGIDRAHAVHRLAEDAEHAAQGLPADGHRNRLAEVDRGHSSDHSFGRLHGNTTGAALTEVLGNLEGDVHRSQAESAVVLDTDGVVDGGEVLIRKLHVHHGTDDLNDASFDLLSHKSLLVSHRAPGRPKRSRSTPW